MKLTVKESNLAVIDESLPPDAFTAFWSYFNILPYAYRSMGGWQKVWRISDGQVLASAGMWHSEAPFNSPMDYVDQTIYNLAKQHFEEIVGKEGEDWTDITYTPYIYPAGTKISWHDDYGYSGACIFYPHQEWKPNWGGELLIARTPPPEQVEKKDDKVPDMVTRDYTSPLLNAYGMGLYVSPLPNRMTFTSGKVWHSINRVDQVAGDNVRCSVVAFFTKQKKGQS